MIQRRTSYREHEIEQGQSHGVKCVMAALKMLVSRRNETRPEKSELLADRPKTANRPDVCRVVLGGVKVAKFVGVFPQHFFQSKEHGKQVTMSGTSVPTKTF